MKQFNKKECINESSTREHFSRQLLHSRRQYSKFMSKGQSEPIHISTDASVLSIGPRGGCVGRGGRVLPTVQVGSSARRA